jgi:hypothetical protein
MIAGVYVGPLCNPDGTRAGPSNVPGVYVFVQRADRRPIRIGQSYGCFGRVRNHATQVGGFCRRAGIDPASLFVIIVPLPHSDETRRLEVERYLQRAFGLRDPLCRLDAGR